MIKQIVTIIVAALVLAARKEQLQWYIRQQGLNIRFYQDYGWPAVSL